MDGGKGVKRAKVQFAYMCVSEKEISTRVRAILQVFLHPDDDDIEELSENALITWLQEYRTQGLKLYSDVKQRIRRQNSS